MSNSDDGSQRPAKRTRLACHNCRRKKTRCSGERPICSNCQRLGQRCRFPDPIDYGELSGYQGQPTSEKIDALGSRISVIENQLSQLTNTINRFISSFPSTSLQNPETPQPGQTFNISSSLPGIDYESHKSTVIHANQNERAQPQASASITLPPPETLSLAADAYFQNCQHQPYCLFHEETFRQDLLAGAVPSHLAFAFLATAIRFISDPLYSEDRFGEALEKSAGVSVVQALVLLTVIDYTGGKCRSGWIKAGLAIRMSYFLQLMREPPDTISIIDQELHRRIFWSVYLLDTLISCGRERPPAILKDSIKLRMPCSETAFRNAELVETPTLDVLTEGTATSALSAADSPWALMVLVCSTFRSCLQYVFQDQRPSRDVPWHPGSRFAELEWSLIQLESNYGFGESTTEKVYLCRNAAGQVDQRAAAPLVYSHALFHASQCLIYHPFLLRRQLSKLGVKTPPSFLLRIFHACETHATALAVVITDAQSNGVEASASMYAFFCFLAGSIHALLLEDQARNMTNQTVSQEVFSSCLQHLEELSVYWLHAKSMVTALESFKTNSARFSCLFDPSFDMRKLSSADKTLLWNSVSNGSLSETTQSRLPQSGDPVADLPFSLWDDGFDFMALDNYSLLDSNQSSSSNEQSGFFELQPDASQAVHGSTVGSAQPNYF